MSNNADRPEVTAAIKKKSLARKRPVIRAITARQDPTYHQYLFALWSHLVIPDKKEIREKEGEEERKQRADR